MWAYDSGDQVWSSPALADGVVYVGNRDGALLALAASDGALLWRFRADDAIDATPAIADGVVYVGAYDGQFYRRRFASVCVGSGGRGAGLRHGLRG
ncbi:MAG: PQQ-binding-like beta-propeller repeat protein [Anaerolineae bacterium]|nr:PQQ-binding-like beta-propeller repeat protein [Anaerolineae bacterium]